MKYSFHAALEEWSAAVNPCDEDRGLTQADMGRLEPFLWQVQEWQKDPTTKKQLLHIARNIPSRLHRRTVINWIHSRTSDGFYSTDTRLAMRNEQAYLTEMKGQYLTDMTMRCVGGMVGAVTRIGIDVSPESLDMRIVVDPGPGPSIRYTLTSSQAVSDLEQAKAFLKAVRKFDPKVSSRFLIEHNLTTPANAESDARRFTRLRASLKSDYLNAASKVIKNLTSSRAVEV